MKENMQIKFTPWDEFLMGFILAFMFYGIVFVCSCVE